MNKTIKVLLLLLVIAIAATCLFACKKDCKHEFDKDGVCALCGKTKCATVGHTWHNGVCVYDEVKKGGWIDYVADLTLDLSANSGRAHTNPGEVSVYNFIDGDTTHFTVPTSVVDVGVLKARYLAVNTPESTGKIEPYGKVASNFTKEKLSNVSDIVLESDNDKWNLDSTSTRYTVWVWYKPVGASEYRNLNLELLQYGLGIASNAEGNCYGETCGKALRQAQAFNYNVNDSDVQDATFYYGDAIPVTLKELRCNLEEYDGKKVSFEGIVAMNYNNGAYVEEYDEVAGVSFGMYVYYGFTNNSDLKNNLRSGNRVRVVGSLTEFHGTYQISDVNYRDLYPDDPNNTITLDDQRHEPQWNPVTVEEFYNEVTVTVIGDDDHADYDYTDDYSALAQATSIYMTNLVVKSVYTTTKQSSSSRGALSITCTQAGSDKEIVIRTGVLKDPNGDFGVPDEFLAKADGSNNPNGLPTGVVLQSYFAGKTFNVRGVVGYFDSGNDDQYGTSPYQINVFSLANITFVS